MFHENAFRTLNILDEFSRECLAIRVDRKLNSANVIDTLMDLFILRSVPAYIRSDNGPEFVAKAVRDWIAAVGAQTAYIEPGSPWENGYCESFNARFRDELLNGEVFYTLRGAQIIIENMSGRVVGLKVFTAGGVIRTGEAILDIVPLDQPLLVEARVNTADIEKLYIGQSSRVRLSAFELGDVPEATGRIIDISADSFEDERTGKDYYVARVALDQTQTGEVSALELVPGMPADLFVNTGKRTALSFLTQPIQDRLARTFIE